MNEDITSAVKQQASEEVHRISRGTFKARLEAAALLCFPAIFQSQTLPTSNRFENEEDQQASVSVFTNPFAVTLKALRFASRHYCRAACRITDMDQNYRQRKWKKTSFEPTHAMFKLAPTMHILAKLSRHNKRRSKRKCQEGQRPYQVPHKNINVVGRPHVAEPGPSESPALPLFPAFNLQL